MNISRMRDISEFPFKQAVTPFFWLISNRLAQVAIPKITRSPRLNAEIQGL